MHTTATKWYNAKQMQTNKKINYKIETKRL